MHFRVAAIAVCLFGLVFLLGAQVVPEKSRITPKETYMKPAFINPKTLCPTNGWTHVATVVGGKTIYISGQVSVNEKGETVGKGDLKAQVKQTFENLKLALAASGATFQHVVKSNIYVVGLKAEMVPTIREVRAQYFSKEQPPVSTMVGVPALVGPDWLIEIELVAVVPE